MKAGRAALRSGTAALIGPRPCSDLEVVDTARERWSTYRSGVERASQRRSLATHLRIRSESDPRRVAKDQPVRRAIDNPPVYPAVVVKAQTCRSPLEREEKLTFRPPKPLVI